MRNEHVCPARPKSNILSNVIPTSEIQKWMSSIEQQLNEVHTITADSKLDSEQKLKISSLCRKIGYNASQMAVLYQSLKQKAVQVTDTIDNLQEKCKLTEHILGLKETIQKSCATRNELCAGMIKKDVNSTVRPNNVSSVTTYPSNTLSIQSSEDIKSRVQNLIHSEQMKFYMRGVRKTKSSGVIADTENKQDAEKSIMNAGIQQGCRHSMFVRTGDEPAKHKPRTYSGCRRSHFYV